MHGVSSPATAPLRLQSTPPRPAPPRPLRSQAPHLCCAARCQKAGGETNPFSAAPTETPGSFPLNCAVGRDTRRLLFAWNFQISPCQVMIAEGDAWDGGITSEWTRTSREANGPFSQHRGTSWLNAGQPWLGQANFNTPGIQSWFCLWRRGVALATPPGCVLCIQAMQICCRLASMVFDFATA